MGKTPKATPPLHQLIPNLFIWFHSQRFPSHHFDYDDDDDDYDDDDDDDDDGDADTTAAAEDDDPWSMMIGMISKSVAS